MKYYTCVCIRGALSLPPRFPLSPSHVHLHTSNIHIFSYVFPPLSLSPSLSLSLSMYMSLSLSIYTYIHMYIYPCIPFCTFPYCSSCLSSPYHYASQVRILGQRSLSLLLFCNMGCIVYMMIMHYCYDHSL